MSAKVENIPKETSFSLRFPALQKPVCPSAKEREQGSAKENAEYVCGFVYGGLVRTHESEAMPLRNPSR